MKSNMSQLETVISMIQPVTTSRHKWEAASRRKNPIMEAILNTLSHQRLRPWLFTVKTQTLQLRVHVNQPPPLNYPILLHRRGAAHRFKNAKRINSKIRLMVAVSSKVIRPQKGLRPVCTHLIYKMLLVSPLSRRPYARVINRAAPTRRWISSSRFASSSNTTLTTLSSRNNQSVREWPCSEVWLSTEISSSRKLTLLRLKRIKFQRKMPLTATRSSWNRINASCGISGRITFQ